MSAEEAEQQAKGQQRQRGFTVLGKALAWGLFCPLHKP
jgi:hypothetical protein